MSPLLHLNSPPSRWDRLRDYLNAVALWLVVALLVLLLLSRYGRAQATMYGQFNTSPPALSNNQIGVLQLDSSGNLKVNLAAGGGGGGTSSNFGALFPSTGTAAGFTDGTNMQPAKVDGSNNLFVNCVVGCAGGSTTPSDTFANPSTAGLTFSLGGFWNGTTWDRVRGDTTSGMWVNIKNSVNLGVTQQTSPWAVGADGVVDANNSTTATLGNGGVFTGTATDTLPYTAVTVALASDQSGTFNAQWSTDNTNWDITTPVAFTGGRDEHMVFHRRARYFRIVFTNGSTPQTYFRMQTILQRIGQPINTVNLSEVVDSDDTALLTRSELVGQKPNGSYSNVGVTNESAVTVGGSGAIVASGTTWSSGTAQNTALVMVSNSLNYNAVGVELVQGSPISGAITFEASIDSSNWIGVTGYNVGTASPMAGGSVYTLSAGTNVGLLFNIVGFNYFRARLSTAITGAGTVVISYTAQGLASPSISTSVSGGSINVNSNQGNPNSASNAWPMKIYDAAPNGPVSVKGGSTANVAGDASLVTQISVNQPNLTTPLNVSATFPSAQPVSGTVTVTQGTGTNLHTVVDSGSITVNTISNFAQETGGNLATLAGGVTSSVYQENLKQIAGTAPAAAGANVSTDSVPLMIAGSDYGGTPVKRIPKVDSTGLVYTSTTFPSAQPVSGTVTANQGGAPWTVKPDGTTWALTGTSANTNVTNATLAVTQSGNWTNRIVGNAGAIMDVAQAATAPANNLNVAGTFNNQTGTTSALTAGQSSALQLDSHGLPLMDLQSEAGTAITNTPTAIGTKGSGNVMSVNADLTSVAGTATVTSAAGVQKVGIVGNANATLDQANGAAVPTNGLQVGGGSVAGGTTFEVLTVKAASTAAAATDTSLVVQPLVGSHVMNTAAAGTQLVGIVGNAAAALDAANNAAAPANVIVNGYEAQSSALGASATAGNVRRGVVGLDGVLYTRQGSPLLWSCGQTAIGATLTQCQAAPAAGTSLYLTEITAVSDTATAGAYTLRYGTGSNCGTGTTTLFPNVSTITTGKIPYPGNTANLPIWHAFGTPLKVPAANALCVICVATNTCTVSMQGFTAP